MTDDVAVVGAGLTGCLLAYYLARRGHRVDLYERRPDPRTADAERGRSINLAISERGLDALRRVGLEHRVMADALPMRGRMVHPPTGTPVLQPYSADGTRAINSISRGALNNTLLDAATSEAGVTVHFEHRLTELDTGKGALTFATPHDEVHAEARVVFGADGAGSAVRGHMLAQEELDESLDFLDYGYKELTVPPVDGEFALDPGALHIWPRGSAMMIALPNPDRSFTCTLFWPTGGTASFASLSSPAAIERHFRTHYPDLFPLAPTLVDDYLANPVGLLGTVRCTPWQAGGSVCLIGDAAHAIVPFYGQGANCGFEDVVVLDRCLDEADSWQGALELFDARRKVHADTIADMALDNFVEMRDKVASPMFRATKAVEHTLERLLPGRYVSRYELVSFSTVPYADVRRRVAAQQRALGGAFTLLTGGIVAATARLSRRNRL
ncbi:MULTISPECIES: FAD-dependent oxidoreductase [Prauserella salsuginis group]|uniref:Kynurenine 3-monooxygenase n=1 Tax=Prauserella salsuginis TaxID=387889 RepID=A0ABW6G1B6_9PSEU|nr:MULTISPECIES: NAD(P)/FAD-dependent oxidoreductase [Prauserella salsuginis group]MCR3722129.1 kynurenine 3-monooxygenase [Prauserella flava]MCR3736126.1 kynurenine 3-monooxygenase [Prauserella salsuginis]